MKKLISLIMIMAMLMPFAPTPISSGEVVSKNKAATATATDALAEEEVPELFDASKIYIENKGNVSYGSTYNSQFYVPSVSKWAFCGDASLDCPASGNYDYSVNTSASWLDEVRGILLYADTLSLSSDKNYLGIMRAINNAKHGSSNTLGAEYQIAAASYVSSNYPSGVMSIAEAGLGFKYGSSDEIYYGKTITADIDGGGDVTGRVVTDMITLVGSSKNSIDISLPDGVWMKYKGVWYKSGTVTISGDASIKFSLAAGDTETYTLKDLKGKPGCDVYEIETGSGLQDLYYGITDYAQISFTLKAKEEEKNDISLSKYLKDNKCNISVAGAEYTVYYVKDATSTGKKYPVAVFTIQDDCKGRVTKVWSVDCNTSGYEASFTASGNGTDILAGLPTGVYRIDETKVPAGLVKADSFYVDFNKSNNASKSDYKITYEKTLDGYHASCTSFEDAVNDPVSIILYKYDANTNDKVAAGNASLEDAYFEVKFYAGVLYDAVPANAAADDIWLIRTIYMPDGTSRARLTKDNVVSHVGSTEYNENGLVYLTIGTITIEEVEAPKGYNKAADGGLYYTSAGEVTGTNKIVLQNKLGSDGGLHLYSGAVDASSGVTYYNKLQKDAITVYEPEKRYDLHFRKVDESGKPMSGVAFLITSKTTGERHVVVTDENGEFSSASASGSVNANDALYEDFLKTGEIPDYVASDIYFYGSMADKSKADLTLGACYMDEYTVTELPCEANKGYRLAEPVTKQVGDNSDTDDFDIGTFVNYEITIHTTTHDGIADKKLIYPENKEITLIDKVSYTNLYTDGREYEVKGKLICKETGEIVKRSDGTEVTGETKFVPEKEDGIVEVEFKYNPYDCGLVGKTTVVFEDLYCDDKHIVPHADIEDEGQTNYYPDITTTLTGEGGSKQVLYSNDVKLTDKVAYENIIADYNYVIEGVLVNKDTGKIITVNGEEVRSEAPFTATAASGTIDVTYKFDAEKAGLISKDEDGNVSCSDVVCYEYLYYIDDNGEKSLKAAHEDINDENQTITLYEKKSPVIRTYLSESDTNAKTVRLNGHINLTDTVKYEELNVNDEYVLIGKLVNKDTEDVIQKKEKSFTVKEEDGTIDMVYDEFDGMEAGLFKEDKSISDVVCYEYLYKKLDDGTLEFVTKHEDITDKDQTVQFELKAGRIIITREYKETTGSQVKTGDNVPVKLLLGLFLATLTGAAVLLLKRKKLQKKAANRIKGFMIIFAVASICAAPKLITHAASEQTTETTEVTQSDVAEDYKAPETFTDNGITYELINTDLVKKYEPVTVTGYKETDVYSSEPQHDATMAYDYTDSKGKVHNLTLSYTDTVVTTGVKREVTYTGRISGYDADYWYIGDNFIPAGSDITADIMAEILSGAGYKGMTDYSFSFNGDAYASAGDMVRDFTITAYETGNKYRFNYAGTFDDIEYKLDAVSTYGQEVPVTTEEVTTEVETEELTTEAITEAATEAVKPETKHKMTTTTKVIISSIVVIGVLAFLALLIYMLKGGRKSTDYKSNRDIRRDYKNLKK